jgi:Fe-S-cluster containining protein
MEDQVIENGTSKICPFCFGSGKNSHPPVGAESAECICQGTGMVIEVQNVKPKSTSSFGRPIEAHTPEPEPTLTNNSTSCACRKCRNFCTAEPGWFLPGEAEKLAETMGVEFQEFFNDKLMVTYSDDYGHDNVFGIAPAFSMYGGGGIKPIQSDSGHCIFFDDTKPNSCEIHEHRPYECREQQHDISEKDLGRLHKAIVNEWDKEGNKDQLCKLLDRTDLEVPDWPDSDWDHGDDGDID